MQFVCSLPEECLMKWFGCHNWEKLVDISVKPPYGDGGTFRVRCPVDGCTKEWTAGSVEQAMLKCDSLYDRLWQKAFIEYGRGAFGTRMKYPSPWWWFQMNVFRRQEEMNH